MALSKHKCISFFFEISSILHWWLKALAVRPLADLGQTHEKREVKWPACSQKLECLIPKKFLFFSLKTIFLSQRQLPCFLGKRYAYFDVYCSEKEVFNLCLDGWILLMLSNGSVTGVEENQSYYQAKLHYTGTFSHHGKFSVQHT